MEEKRLTAELESFDFSRCHPVREELLDRLLAMHRLDNAGQKKWQGYMDDADLDLVTAAGTPHAGAAPYKKHLEK